MKELQDKITAEAIGHLQNGNLQEAIAKALENKNLSRTQRSSLWILDGKTKQLARDHQLDLIKRSHFTRETNRIADRLIQILNRPGHEQSVSFALPMKKIIVRTALALSVTALAGLMYFYIYPSTKSETSSFTGVDVIVPKETSDPLDERTEKILSQELQKLKTNRTESIKACNADIEKRLSMKNTYEDSLQLIRAKKDLDFYGKKCIESIDEYKLTKSNKFAKMIRELPYENPVLLTPVESKASGGEELKPITRNADINKGGGGGGWVGKKVPPYIDCDCTNAPFID